MKLAVFSRPARPWFHVWPATADEVVGALQTWELASSNQRIARVIRGRKSTTASQLFDEVAAALQFPNYFGDNWDAFNDCFCDLRHFGNQSAIVLAFTDAQLLLKSGTDRVVRTFAEILTQAAEEFNATRRPRRARAFHIVFQVLPEQEDETRRRWAAAGLKWE